MTEKISGVYKITNTVTGDFYIGSSKNIKKRWVQHKKPSTWKRYPNNPMYLDFQKYGVDSFDLQILEDVEIDYLKESEQKFIDKLQPTYNSNRANGWDVERRKEYQKKYDKKYYQQNRENKKKYYQQNRENKKKYDKKYYQQNRENKKEYYQQFCSYNGETLKLCALATRFRRAGIKNPTLEAKKYILTNYKDK